MFFFKYICLLAKISSKHAPPLYYYQFASDAYGSNTKFLSRGGGGVPNRILGNFTISKCKTSDSLQIWARWRQNWNWLFAKLNTTYYWLRKCGIPENININSVINILYWFQIWSLFVAGWENLNFQYIYFFQICLYKFYLSAVKIHIRPHRKALSMPTVCMCSRSLYCCFYYIRIKTENKFMHCQYSQTMHEFIFGFNLDLK